MMEYKGYLGVIDDDYILWCKEDGIEPEKS